MIHEQPLADTCPRPDCDSLTADLVNADDQGGTTLLPTYPEALAQFLAQCRALECPATDPPQR